MKRIKKAMDAFQLQILQCLYEGVYFVDERRTITFWNLAAETITGFKAEEIVGSRCMDNLLNHVDEKGNRLCLGGCPLSHALEDGKVREETLYLHHKDGHRVAVETRVVPLKDSEGRVMGAAEIFVEHPNLVSLEARPPSIEGEFGVPVGALVTTAMRMTPKWLIVGEIRTGDAALWLLRAQMSDHPGLSTDRKSVV